MRNRLLGLYKRLLRRFGRQHWWPAENEFEVIVGVILTQNTNWSNVERAIKNLKKQNLLSCKKLLRVSQRRLAEAIRPAGYFNIKARRLRHFVNYLSDKYGGSLKRMFDKDIVSLRKELLSINGIGPESADSIILYAAHKPIFVVDAYTKRFLSREGFIKDSAGYEEIQRLFMDNLPRDAALFGEYHALIVRLGKENCRKVNPICVDCPVNQKRKGHTPGSKIRYIK